MNEKIYTIPVNEAFDDTCKCPICTLYKMQEARELETIMGASMMEPDIRIKTNQMGFCSDHFSLMYKEKNRLSLALMLETHIDEINKHAFDKSGFLSSKPDTKKQAEYIDTLEKSCYLCSRINAVMSKFLETIYYLYRTEPDFREKFKNQTMFCLHHYKVLVNNVRIILNKTDAAKFLDDISTIQKSYMKTLSEDVKWFCKKFDYRYKDADWKNSKDAIPRAIEAISGLNPEQNK